MHFFIDTLLYSFLIRLILAEHESNSGLPPLVEPLENLKEMQAYIDDSESENGETDSYLFAFSRAKYNDEINTDSHVRKRIKRSEPEYIKFELADAKEPDEMTKQFFQQLREQRKLESEKSSATEPPQIKRSDDRLNGGYPVMQHSGDQSAGESQSYEILSPGSRQILPSQEIPVGVRKAIEGIVLQKRSLYNNQPAKRYASAVDSSNAVSGFIPSYGEAPYKLASSQFSKTGLNLDFASQIPYIPALFPTHDIPHIREPKVTSVNVPLANTPTFHSQSAEVPRLKYVHFAKPLIKPASVNLAGPIQSAPSPQNNVNINLPPGEKNIEISFDNHLGSNADDIDGLSKQYLSLKRLLLPSKAEAMTKVLTNLISKTPTEQLKELTEILAAKRNNPERNTAPIVFPPVNVAPEPEPEARHKFVSLIPAVTEAPKKFTPITEQQVDDVTPEPYLQYLPVKAHSGEVEHTTPSPPKLAVSATSYKEVNLGPTITHHNDESKKLQYASKYNFGYRIRDFHTGNDFGHTEKRDNDGVTRGQYHILLPDGRIQNVEYHVDDSGYHADVSYANAS